MLSKFLVPFWLPGEVILFPRRLPVYLSIWLSLCLQSQQQHVESFSCFKSFFLSMLPLSSVSEGTQEYVKSTQIISLSQMCWITWHNHRGDISWYEQDPRIRWHMSGWGVCVKFCPPQVYLRKVIKDESMKKVMFWPQIIIMWMEHQGLVSWFASILCTELSFYLQRNLSLFHD